MASSKMVSVNSERLKFARAYYGLSITDVSEKTKVRYEKIQEFEAGTDFPTYSELNKLADYYHQSLLFFFFDSQPKEGHLAAAFRGLEQQSQGMVSKRTKELIERANIYRLNLTELNKENAPPCFSSMLQNDQVSAAQLCRWLRKKLDLSEEKQVNGYRRAEGLLEYIRTQFYNIGVYIFKDSFQENAVSGLCLYDENFPVILINNKTTFTRQLFTVFHEIYHIYLQETDVDFTHKSEERECDIFASSFLIPAGDFCAVVNEQKRCEDDDFVSFLAERYCVSRDAICYRLLKAGKISQAYYQRQHDDNIRKFNPMTSGGNFYYTKMSYLGQPYLNTVFSKYYSGQIPISQVGIYTQMKAANVSKLASSMFGGEF